MLLVAVAIYSSISQNIQLYDFTGEDKLAHAFFYFLMTMLGIYAFKWYAALWVAGLSGALELIQRYVPTRNFNLFDLLSNMLGIGAASLIVSMIYAKIYTRRSKNQESGH